MDNSDSEKDIKFNKFKKCFFEFQGEFINTFPEYKIVLEENYMIDSFSEKEIEVFVNNLEPHILEISLKNNEVFKNNVIILKGVNFPRIWYESNLSKSIKESIWKYIHTLYLLGKSLLDKENINFQNIFDSLNMETDEEISNKSKVYLNMLNNISVSNSSEKEKSSDTDTKKEDESNKTENNFNFAKNNPIFPNIDLENSNIAKIAHELADDINMDDLNINNMGDIFSTLMGNNTSGGGGGIMDLVQKVGDKIKTKIDNGNINETDLLAEAQKMMGQLHNGPAKDIFKNFNMNTPQNNPFQSNPTKDRLKKKLEKKKTEKQIINDEETTTSKKKKRKKKKKNNIEQSENLNEQSEKFINLNDNEEVIEIS